ncbi:MAG: ATP-binding protein, partial [Treponema sp.]|nr:ATP-binding protein [Treponema sp.]
SPNMAMYLETDGSIKYLNPSVSGISGYTREELQEHGLALMFSPEDFERLSTDYIAAVLKKVLASFEMTVVAKNGAKRDFIFSVVPVQMYDGSCGLGFTGRDITELKHTQRDLETARQEAEKALASELKYNKAKSDFLSKVSHELRTPINAIIGLTGIAGKAGENGEAARTYDRIKAATEHLLGLVNDILDMTSFDTGNFEFVSAPFSFKKVIESVVDDIGPKALARKQIFSTHIDDKIGDGLVSDERRLKQALSNLLSNAVKFTPDGGSIKLSAHLLESDGDQCTIRFDVYDNGIGISPEALEYLGQAFEQGDNTITREHGGMGLGLSLTMRIVEMMNGQIWVESEPGKGSRFSCEVRFGISRTELPEDARTGAEAAARETAPELPVLPDLTGKRILVVDDVEINREILCMILGDTGANFDNAGHGGEAVALFLKEQYDLILLDLHMPVMDGFTAAKAIRASAQPRAGTIPIIAVSAESSGELHAKCLDAGITGHIVKPVDTEVLLKMITKHMAA